MKYMMFVCTDTEPDTDPTEPRHRRVGGGERRPWPPLSGNVLAPTSRGHHRPGPRR